jgi:DNA-binding CsgD family transcriptional regulator
MQATEKDDMTPVSVRDSERLQCAILALHSHRDLASFRRAVPGIFLDLIPGHYFSLADTRLDADRRSFEVLDLWESRPVRVGEARDAFVRNVFDHPFVQHMLEHGRSGALVLSDFMTVSQLRRTRLYRETLAPVDFGRLLSIGSFGGPGTATLSVARPESAPDFTERDRRMMELLQPHFDLARANLGRESQLRADRSRSLKGLGLTPREIEVALWLAQGKTNHEVAIILSAPVRTIEKHVEHVLHKLSVEHRAAAAVAVAEIIRA